MKKTILAVVTSTLLAASAQAATVYDKDGQTVDVYGRIQYQAGQIYNADNGKAENFGGDTLARFGFNGKWATASDISLIGKLEWEVSSEADDADESNQITSRYAFAGADFGNGVQATVGTQDSAYVQLSDVTDVYNEYSGAVENQFDSRWDDSVKVTYVADGWDLRASAAAPDSEKTDTYTAFETFGTTFTAKEKAAYGASAGYTAQIDDLSSVKGVLAYQGSKYDVAGAQDLDMSQYAAGVGYTYDALYLASTYGQLKAHTEGDSAKATVWTVTATYKFLPEVTGVLGYGLVDPHNLGEPTSEYYVVGAQYDITAKAKVYTEYKFNQVSGQDDNYYVGMQYNF